MFTQQNLKLAAYSLQKSGFTDHDCMEPFLRVRYGKPASYKGRARFFLCCATEMTCGSWNFETVSQHRPG